MMPNNRILYSTMRVLGCVMLISGCSHQPKTSPSIMIDPPESSNTALILEARAEVEELRAALASERIQTAKQAAEVQAAQQEASALRDREAKYVQRIASLKAELDTLKTERDQIREENAALRGKVASLPELLQLMAEIRTVKSSINGVVSSLKTLKAKLGNSKGTTITVKRGDTLWHLSRMHGTTVKHLKEINGLHSDRIIAGQQLQIPLTRPPGDLSGLAGLPPFKP